MRNSSGVDYLNAPGYVEAWSKSRFHSGGLETSSLGSAVASSADFDRYVAEHGIPADDYPAAFALWIAEVTGVPVPRVEKVEELGA
jgi:hypothetical protein